MFSKRNPFNRSSNTPRLTFWDRFESLKATAYKDRPVVELIRQFRDDPELQKRWVESKLVELRLRMKLPRKQTASTALVPTVQTSPSKKRPLIVMICAVALLSVVIIALVLAGLSAPTTTNAQPISTTVGVIATPSVVPPIDVPPLVPTTVGNTTTGTNLRGSSEKQDQIPANTQGILVVLEPGDDLNQQFSPIAPAVLTVGPNSNTLWAFVPLVQSEEKIRCFVRTIFPGDTLTKISRQLRGYGLTVQQIAHNSGIANPDLIYVGQKLTICLY